MRRLAILVGVVLMFLPAFWVVRLFGNLNLGWSLLGLLPFYGCILAGVALQRRRGRTGGYFAFRGAMQFILIAAVIGFVGPFVYAALTHTTAGNMAPIWGVFIIILGSIAAVGTGLLVYGTQRSDKTQQ
jgi:cytochrome c biogenesis protein CcdA